ncbi:MAG: hypothetical protein KJ666_10025 [Bacteroidetes bacterium]|nr:hypothetical protein [Bacteroidota bacterium]
MRNIIILLCLLFLVTHFPKREFIQPARHADYTLAGGSNIYNPEHLDIISLGPPNYQLYDYMKIYSEQYDIPFDFALKCARWETGYKGKFHFTYRPFEDRLRRSYADAYGPLQVQVPTANDMWIDRTITADDLGYDIKINVITSFRYKKYLYDMYKDWLKVYSIYNMGWKGIHVSNDYAIKIVNRKL